MINKAILNINLKKTGSKMNDKYHSHARYNNYTNNNKIALRHNHNKELKLYYDHYYHGYTVMKHQGPLIEPYLDNLYQTFNKALNQYTKVFVFRVDLRLPNDPIIDYKSDTKIITRFIESLKAKIKHNRLIAKLHGNYHDTELRYVWVKEASQDGGVHYHFVSFVNGNAFRAMGDFDSESSNMFNRVQSAWSSALGIYDFQSSGLVNVSGQWLIHSQNYYERYGESNAVFYAASYLCKAATKNYGDGSKWFGCSRL